MGERGFSVAIELIGMHVHGDAKRLEYLRPQLRRVAQYPALCTDRRGSQMDEHHFGNLMKWILTKGSKDGDARAIALTLAKQLAADPDGPGGRLIKPLLPLLMKDSEIVWPQFGQAIVSDRLKAWRFEQALGDSHSFSAVKQPALFFFVPFGREIVRSECRTIPMSALPLSRPSRFFSRPAIQRRQRAIFIRSRAASWANLATARMCCERSTAT